MQYRGVRAFCLAAQHLSFKDAADELSVTPSAISHQIRHFENYLGCKLFTRGTRAIELTLEGQRLYADLRTPVSAIEHAVTRLRASPDRVPLRIEMPAFFASELFVPRMSLFSRCNQQIDLRIETTAPNDRQSRQADLHIVLSDELPDALCSEKLFPIVYQPACSPEQFEYWCDKAPEDLQMATLIVHEARPDAWQQWFADLNATLPTPKQTITVDSMYALARATAQGAGIALIPLPVSRLWFQKRELIPLFDTQLISSDSYWLVAQQPLHRESATGTLWNWIVEEFSSNSDTHELLSTVG